MSRTIKVIAAASATALTVTACVVLFAPAPNAGAAGGTIVSPDPVGNTGAFSSLELDAAGNPVISYLQLPSSLRILHCGNSSCTAGNTIASQSLSGLFASESIAMVLSASGNPAIAYATGPGFAKVHLLRCGDPACVSKTDWIVASPGVLGTTPGLALDAADNPIITYGDVMGTSSVYRVLHCGNPTCSSGNTVAVVGTGGYFSSMALDAGGNPVIAYEDDTTLDLVVLHCGNATCTSGNTSVVVDNGYTPSLALDALGRPVVSYSSGGALKVLHCGNAACSSGNTISTFGPSREGSLALDSTGNPVVGYYRDTSDDLNVLHCNEPLCVGGDESITSPDALGDVGAFSSLALDVGGNPVVSYQDRNYNDLKVLHCGDPNCGGVKVVPTPKPTATPAPLLPLDFHIGVDTDGNGTDDCSSAPSGPATCYLPPASTFVVKFYIDSTGGIVYASYDANLYITGLAGKYVFDFTPWPPCAYSASSPPSTFPVIGFGCAAFQQTSAYVGLLARAQLTCAVSGSVDLRHGIGKTDIVDLSLHEHFEAPSGSESLQIDCNSTPTPAPPAPTATPTSAAVGGVAVDAMSGSPDGLLIAFAVFAGGLVVLFGGAAVARARAR